MNKDQVHFGVHSINNGYRVKTNHYGLAIEVLRAYDKSKNNNYYDQDREITKEDNVFLIVKSKYQSNPRPQQVNEPMTRYSNLPTLSPICDLDLYEEDQELLQSMYARANAKPQNKFQQVQRQPKPSFFRRIINKITK